MKKRFEGKHGVEFENIQEQDLINDIAEHNNPDLRDALKNAVTDKNHYQQSVKDICDDIDKRKKEKSDRKKNTVAEAINYDQTKENIQKNLHATS